MSFKIGGQKSNTNSSMTQTTTPNVPDWVLGPSQQFASNITDLAKTDPASLVPGQNDLQNQAAAGAANLSGSPWNFNAAADTTRAMMGKATPQVQSASLLDNLQSYYNPFKQQIIDPVQADLAASEGQTRAAQDLAIAGGGAGAFGGSGAALAKSLTNGELDRARGATMGNLYQSMFNTSTGLSGQDAQRRQDASTSNAQLTLADQQQKAQLAQQLANLSTQFDANNRANIDTQSTVGGTDRAITQEQALAPFSMQDALNKLLQGLNPSMYVGQTTTGSSKGASSGISANAGFSYGKGG